MSDLRTMHDHSLSARRFLRSLTCAAHMFRLPPLCRKIRGGEKGDIKDKTKFSILGKNGKREVNKGGKK